MRAKGIFISEYQNTFKYLDNLDYIWQRITDGMVTDAQYFAMLPEVKKVPRRGATHNYRNHVGWKTQADNFLWLMDASFQMISGDYEDSNMTEQSAIDFWCWLNYIAEETNLPVFYYVALYNLKDRLMAFNGTPTEYGPIDFNSSNLWIARPTENADFENGAPGLTINGVPVTDNWRFWQYWWKASGAKYGCGSVYVCEDVFNGTVEELDKLLGTNNVDDIAKILGELQKQINLNILGIAELAKRMATLQQGLVDAAESQLRDEQKLTAHLVDWTDKLVGEHGIYERFEDLEEAGYEEEMAGIHKTISDHIINNLHYITNLDAEIDRLEDRIDGLQGGHNHPKWMKKLGLVKDE